MQKTNAKTSRFLAVNVLAIGLLAASIGPSTAGTKAQKVVASIHGISHVSLRTWTTDYPWVRFRTSSGSGTPVRAVVRVHCVGGQRKTLRWSAGDGSSLRVVHIRSGQGKCYENFNARAGEGARLGISVAVKR